MKTSILNLVTVFLLSLLVACGTSEKPPVVGISMGPTHERWKKDINYLTQQLELRGAEVIVKEALGSETEQAKQAQDLIDDEKLDVLVIVPVNSETAGIIVDYAAVRGIKVIAYDRIVKECDLHCYLSFDNVKIGEIMAEYLTKIKPRGKYAILGGDTDDSNTNQLRIGQMNILQPLIIRGDIEIVLDVNVEGWSADKAYEILKEFLEEGGELDAIVSSSDELSTGASRALQEFNMGKKVLLSGQDAQTAACRRIVEGQQTMTVYKMIESLASSTAQMAVLLARGQDIPNTLTTINNGEKMVPSILLPNVIPVGEENIRITVIADGFMDEHEVFGDRLP